jgi:uncharacterized protein (DUF1501 family)
MNNNISRRHFLKQGSAYSALAATGLPFALNTLASNAAAQSAPADDYRAIVCVFLAGGNDAFNTVIRTDSVSMDGGYKSKRNRIALKSTDILPLNDKAGNALNVGVNDRLGFVATEFNASNLAIIANIGPLHKPMTAADAISPANTNALPRKLYSHNDQQSTWMCGQPDGGTSGWGGEMARLAAPLNSSSSKPSQAFSAISMDGATVFCSGASEKISIGQPPLSTFAASRTVGALRFGCHGPQDLDGQYIDPTTGSVGAPKLNYSWSRQKLLSPILKGTVGSSSSQSLLETDYLAKLSSANQAWLNLSSVVPALSQDDINNESALTQQLHMVSNIIKAHKSGVLAGTRRQVFFVQLGGFDTHSDQEYKTPRVSAHDRLLGTLNGALDAFKKRLATDLGNVTVFTASDFGRKLQQNGDGCDHGWGGHSVIFGGAVTGGKIVGALPALTLDTNGKLTDPQLMEDGTMVPVVSTEHLMDKLGNWFVGSTWAGSDARKVLLPHITSDAFKVKDAQGNLVPIPNPLDAIMA